MSGPLVFISGLLLKNENLFPAWKLSSWDMFSWYKYKVCNTFWWGVCLPATLTFIIQKRFRRWIWQESYQISFPCSFHRNDNWESIGLSAVVILVTVMFFMVMLVAESEKPCQRVSNADRKGFCESGKFLQHAHYWLKNFQIIWKMSGCYTKYPDKSVRII